MPVFNNILAGASGATVDAGPYKINRSLRFNDDDASSLRRTISSSGNLKTYTLSMWVKRSKLGYLYSMLYATNGTNGIYYQFKNTDKLEFADYYGASYQFQLVTSRVFRDTSAWYHIVVAVDTTQSTASDRVKIYVNGVQETNFDTENYPAQNYEGSVNRASIVEDLGDMPVGGDGFNGYLADVHLLDGQAALAPTDFGEFDDNGVWQPKAYSGTYGTNGFHLDFSDNSSNAALGTDSSGNSNTWTVNNLSVASGAGNDSLIDTPTNYEAASGNNGGNYATLNPLDNGGLTLSNGNLTVSRATNSWRVCRAGIGITSGKHYWEYTLAATTDGSNSSCIGIAKSDAPLDNSYVGETASGWAFYSADGRKVTSDSFSSYGSGMSNGDTIGVAFDADNGTLAFYQNGSSLGNAFTGLTSGPYFPAVSLYGTQTYHFNFGQRPFAYTPPTGYKSLCTTNLPDPTIADGSTAFDTKLYTGTGNALNVTGLQFNPDLVWLKPRSAGGSNNLFDAVRGVEKYLLSDSTLEENGGSSGTGSLTSFNADGFSLGTASYINTLNTTYVGWTWDAGTTTGSNTDGTITSSVRANPSAGFSIVSYAGALSGAGSSTVGHGLNAAPSLFIVKNRDASENWVVFHESLGNAAYLSLNLTSAQTTGSSIWGSTSPTSSVFTVGYSSQANISGNDYIAYCFAPVEGYSAFGSYTGNGNADGPFVYTGFRPRWALLKESSSAGELWVIYDSERNTSNVMGKQLYPSSNAAEADASADTHARIDFLSNGFKIRGSHSSTNTSGETIVYAAFAEHPFKTARAR